MNSRQQASCIQTGSVTTMASVNKLRHFQRSDFPGPRRGKPGVRALNLAIRDQVDREHELVQLLAADALVRESQLQAGRYAPDPLVVWYDFDQFRDHTNIGSEHLPKWNEVGEFLKLHLLLRASLIFGGYSLTARVRPDLQAKWIAEGRSAGDRIHKLIANALSSKKLTHLALGYVIEGKGRRGHGQTSLHIHGVVQIDNPLDATRLKVALEQALSVHKNGRAAAGVSKKSGVEVLVEPIYDAGSASQGTAGRWAGYFAKNATRPDKRLGPKKTFISQEGRRLARDLWSFMRGD